MRFDRIHERDGQTDRQTPWQHRPLKQSIARQIVERPRRDRSNFGKNKGSG